MNKSKLGHYKWRLESHHGEAVGFLDRAREETRALDIVFSQDSEDQSITCLCREFLFEQISQRRVLIRKDRSRTPANSRRNLRSVCRVRRRHPVWAAGGSALDAALSSLSGND